MDQSKQSSYGVDQPGRSLIFFDVQQLLNGRKQNTQGDGKFYDGLRKMKLPDDTEREADGVSNSEGGDYDQQFFPFAELKAEREQGYK